MTRRYEPNKEEEREGLGGLAAIVAPQQMFTVPGFRHKSPPGPLIPADGALLWLSPRLDLSGLQLPH